MLITITTKLTTIIKNLDEIARDIQYTIIQVMHVPENSPYTPTETSIRDIPVTPPVHLL